ncbi:hypothetical protein GGR55DRAFT_661329 [Xylaria sp. FL0064]|nr:hypothetical protein GGR55DRAFT_661329 [Xylaria sp. FL0064]
MNSFESQILDICATAIKTTNELNREDSDKTQCEQVEMVSEVSCNETRYHLQPGTVGANKLVGAIYYQTAPVSSQGYHKVILRVAYIFWCKKNVMRQRALVTSRCSLFHSFWASDRRWYIMGLEWMGESWMLILAYQQRFSALWYIFFLLSFLSHHIRTIRVFARALSHNTYIQNRSV